MKYKKRMILLIFTIFVLFSLASVCASEVNETDIVSDDSSQVELSLCGEVSDNLETGFDENLQAPSTFVITNSTFNDYFTGGELNDKVDAGSTLDFQGTFNGPDYKVNITKPVNIISSTHDALFNATGKTASSGGCFHISSDGSGTNVSDIKFLNSAFYVTNATNIVIDNIHMLANASGIGQGTGFMCVQSGSRYVTIRNSYFENGGTGSSMIVIGYSDYCLFDSNEVYMSGGSGNSVYLTTFVSSGPHLPTGNVISNNYIHGMQSGFCIPLVVVGADNVIDNNTINYTGPTGISNQYYSPSPSNTTYTNNVLIGGCAFTTGVDSYIAQNSVEGGLNAGANSYVLQNTVGGAISAGSNCTITDNKMKSLSLSKPNVVVDNNDVGNATIEEDASNSTLINNNINGPVEVKTDNNTIQKNIIKADAVYAIDLFSTTGNEVSFNNLTSNNFTGNAAVNAGENNNVHDNNYPDSFLIIDDVIMAYGEYITVSAKTEDAIGITAQIDGNNVSVNKYTITISGLTSGIHNLTVTTITDGKHNPVTKKATITVSIVVTNSTFNNYFTDGVLNDSVDSGSILDFQGTFNGPDYKVNITKPVNIISSTHDALFNETGKTLSDGVCFHISSGGSGTNVSDIKFLNTAFFVTNASDVVIDNIHMVANISGVGRGTGFMCVQSGSRYVTIRNSYFENGGTGSSMIVIGYSDYCTVDSNEVYMSGGSGNSIYITTFVSRGPNLPTGNVISNNNIHGVQSGFCMPVVVVGADNVIYNNTINYTGPSGISNQYSSPAPSNTTYTNNVLIGGCALTTGVDSYIAQNSVEGALNAGANSYVLQNTVGGTMAAGSNCTVTDNKMKSLSLSKPNVVVDNNDIGNATIEEDASNSTLINNNINGPVEVKSDNNTIQKNIIKADAVYAIDLFSTTGNEVSFNNLTSNNFTGNAAVKAGENNNVHDNNYPDSSVIVEDVVMDYGDSIDVVVKTEDAIGITAKIDGNDVSVDNYTITISGLTCGIHNLTVTTITDGKHNPVTKKATITVNKLGTQITANPVTTTYNVNKNLVITLKDSKNNPLSGVSVTVALNGTKTFTTDKNGQVKISTKSLAPKNYVAKITFRGNDIYNKSAKNVNVVVKKATPKLYVAKKTFKKSVKTKKYTVILKTNLKKPLKNRLVTLKVNKKTYKAKTNAKGYATFKITKLTKKGKFWAIVKFAGNSYYNAVAKKAIITVK